MHTIASPTRALEQPLLTVNTELLITPFYEDDSATLLRAAQDPEMLKQLGLCRPLNNLGDCERWITECGEMADEGRGLRLAVRDQAFRVVGCVEMSLQPGGGLMIGYWTASWTRGQGIATRAAAALCDWAQSNYPDCELGLATVPGNRASEKVAIRLGFALIGEEVVEYPGRGETLLRFWSRF